jgi:DNA-binding MarR family transcriptional regulator
MDEPLPFTTLLSFALVAFTIETDNAAESLTPHTTTRQGKSTAVHGPWLTSMVMWLNCLKHVPEEGITARELERRARTGTNLNGMMRWGYIFMAPSPMDTRAKPPMLDWIVNLTKAGSAAKQAWEPLPAAIERQWEKRFGWEEIAELRSALRAVVAELPPTLPNCMPILGFGLAMTGKPDKRSKADEAAMLELVEALSLPELLARVLVAFAQEFENVSKLSLALCADVLRVMSENGVRVRDLPALSGVSKEAIAMALGFMGKRGLAVEEQEGAGKARAVKLTPKGRAAQLAYQRLESEIAARWEQRFGSRMANLRRALEKLLGDSGRDQAVLLKSTEPPKDCWRAEVPRPTTLPWFPMVLHRGGYPDGS